MRKAVFIVAFFLSLWTWSFLGTKQYLKEEKLKKTSSVQDVYLPGNAKYDSNIEKGLCSGEEFSRAVISLTFDDGWKEIYENAVPILDAAGIKSTHYVNIYGPAEPEKFVTSEEIIKAYRNGHEIASHGINHKRFTNLTDPEIRREMENSHHLLSELGIDITGFAYPYGEFTDYSVELSRRSKYSAVRITIPSLNDRKTDRFMLYGYELQNWMVFDPYIKRLVDRAVADKKWLILIFHQVAKPDYQYYTSPQDLSRLVEYLVKQKVPVMRVKDVIEKCY